MHLARYVDSVVERRVKRDSENYLQKNPLLGCILHITWVNTTDDVRHRAAEYSRAATGEDKIDKSALPEVMLVKNFGFAGYSLGLAKDDSTDKRLDVCQYVLERVQ